jgi:hypothetical protein
MTGFALSMWDLGLWFAASSITILIGAEFLSPHYGKSSVLIDWKKLRIIGISFGLLFLIVASLKAASFIY